MKVFISWSGKRSKALAVALKDWLPLVLQYVEPWVSDKDISAGDRWAQAIAGELDSSNFGILCITPENISSEWILFEAGALSKSMLDAKVIPLLYGLELSDLGGPLSQFQALKVDEPGVLSLVKSINSVSDTKASDATVERLVPALWPDLKEKLDEIPDKEIDEKHMRPQTEILEDLVSQVRGLGSRLSEFDSELGERLSASDLRSRGSIHPRFYEDILRFSIRDQGGELALVILAGLIRERFPWLAEAYVENSRKMLAGGVRNFGRLADQLMEITRFTIDGPMAHDRQRTKEEYILTKELSYLLDMALKEMREFLEREKKSDEPRG